ncbi:helix-turn-helix transcriptional regulator [Kitasatospora sp. RB6PN24]|uniref:helix-turn-helix domain-containing protein n=1 Tax=Kitasatospora humi TaxID=2893891 RepID=UPI001E569025|nr:helix-turn-helix transcriptional regulator [Kitasatospora humi]MCC9311144.1 helix-turn-helix transcriptional regulator [Kitasatospora humi]
MPNVRAIPTVRRRRLGRALRKYRLQAKLSLDQVAGLMGAKWDGPKVSRIENAQAKINALEVAALLGHYGVTDTEVVAALEELARNAGRTGWWSTYDGVVPQSLEDLMDAEAGAREIRAYYATVIPGLLQTGAYAREITAATAIHIPAQRHAAIVDVRMGRQANLTRPADPAEYWFVIHEALLCQKFSPHPSLMREQCLRLMDVSELANVNLQIMPLDAGPHPGARGNFSILHFPKPWPSLVSIESAGESRYLESEEASERFQKDFDRIVASALPADRSRDTIRKYMEGMVR